MFRALLFPSFDHSFILLHFKAAKEASYIANYNVVEENQRKNVTACYF